MLSLASTSLLLEPVLFQWLHYDRVSMPSRAYASLLLKKSLITYLTNIHLVSMPSRAVTSFLPPYQSRTEPSLISVNALSGCYLISTVPLQKPRFYAVSRDCFCRYLSEYSDSNSFSCMLTIWTYLMR